MDSTSYSYYNSYGSIKNLNKNIVPVAAASQFPRRLYSSEPFNQSRCQPLQYDCPAGPRDVDIDYFLVTERETHPPYPSRFANPWCPNGYCVGNMPGRYNTAPAFRWQTNQQPVNTAPARFYSGKHVDENYVSSPAYENSAFVRSGFW